MKLGSEGDGDVVSVVTPLGGVAQAFHGDQVVGSRCMRRKKWKRTVKDRSK